MNKVLVTGLALTNFEESSSCNLCNYDYSWIFNHPSVLLWADKIVLTPTIKSVIDDCIYPEENGKLAKAIKILFDILGDSDLIELQDEKRVLTTTGVEQITEQIEKDRILLSEKYPSKIKLGDDKKVPGQFFIETNEYCLTRIAQIYISLLLSRAWNASCLFEPAIFDFLRYRIGIINVPKQSRVGVVDSFKMILESYLPNLPLVPHYAYGQECAVCKSQKKCSDTYLNDLERNAVKIIKWRAYDEINQLKEIIQDLIDNLNTCDEIDTDEIHKKFQTKALKMNKLINGVFPKIKRWSHLITCASIPFAIAGLAISNPLLTLTSASFAGSLEITKQMLSWIESKNRWIGFTNY